MSHNANRTALPDDVVPSIYALRIHVKLEEFAFSGEEEVQVDVRRATDTVVVNGKDVQVQKASFEGVGDAVVSYDDAKERILFKFSQTLPVGKGKLRVAFTGVLNDKLKGFYRSKYSVNGENRYMAVTQFEPVDARRAFPCWDEPAIKAQFDVTLVVPQNRTAISNMPVVEDKPAEGGLKAVRFDRTPIMSTYLLAFVVGEFDFIEGKTTSGVLVRCYTTPGKAEQGRFALDVAVKTLPFYDEYFGIPYPLPKMDLLAIPDFAAGAMENWGCVTYRETALLYDPQNSSSTAKQYIAIVVGHELAHQWFGNLVTMDWWTHLWLNEGFASWIEYLAVDHCFPEWDIWTQFVYSDLGRAMNLDGLANSHPVEVPINDPAEIDEIFDAISYSKGCSIIRMLANWLGTESFKKGLHNYLKHFAYKNALTEDLWHFLGEASGKPVKELMDTWTKITGYPVVSVKEAGVIGHQHHYEITQQRFLSSGPVPSDQSLWQIPLGLASHKNQHHPTFQVFKHREGKAFLDSGADDWVKFNPSQTGFYRVQYPPAMLEKLRHGIEKLELSPIDRLGVENDVLSLAKAGFVSIADALSVAKAFTNEQDYTVWADLNSKLAEIEVIVSNTPYYDQWKNFGRNLYKKALHHVGWDPKPNEKHTAGMLRALVILKSGSYGDQAVIAEAKRRFAAYLENPSSLSPDLRSAVYQTVLANDPSSYDALMKLYAKTTLQEEKVRIQRSLGALSDPALLNKVLDWSLSEEVRLQDAVFIVVAVAANPKGRDLAWAFVQKNFDLLAKKYEGGFLLGHLVRVPQNFASAEKAEEVEKFYGAKNLPGVERTVRQAVESIRSNAAWLHRDSETIHKWLQQHAHF